MSLADQDQREMYQGTGHQGTSSQEPSTPRKLIDLLKAKDPEHTWAGEKPELVVHEESESGDHAQCHTPTRCKCTCTTCLKTREVMTKAGLQLASAVIGAAFGYALAPKDGAVRICATCGKQTADETCPEKKEHGVTIFIHDMWREWRELRRDGECAS